ncbi:FecR domain-containing protein [Chitinophaga sp. MM2321]|uniref:FecR family protein n=1 Tax=Chitinophaga sp. MM2321 TaxID=3137178 RepID=UPI0032D581E8
MESKSLSALIARYLNEDLSEEEAAQLWASLEKEGDKEQWDTAISALLLNKAAHGLSDPERMKQVLRSVLEEKNAQLPLKPVGGAYRRWTRWAAAAVILAAIVTGATFLFSKKTAAPLSDIPVAPQHDVKPGSNKAVLTLADGSKIALGNTGNGALAQQGNVQVIQPDSGQLAYNAAGTGTAQAMQYNILTIPRGGQFRLTLPDGTNVWLNAASSIRYPTAFTGNDRSVQLTGEAYFEVAKIANKPFRVLVNDMEVQVLGTHFNVMAYTDESAIKTTLLEGAVNVNTASGQTKLSPGQQARLKSSGGMTVVSNVDVDEIVAWKNGYFQFNHERLTGVMRQIARWYDVDVSYEGNVPAREFGGKISRNSSIEDVLKILELTKVHFRIEKKKIIVIP